MAKKKSEQLAENIKNNNFRSYRFYHEGKKIEVYAINAEEAQKIFIKLINNG